MKKTFTAFMLIFALVFVLFSCSEKKTEDINDNVNTESLENEKSSTVKYKDEISVYTMTGPTGMGMAKLISDKENSKTKLNYNFNIVTNATEISAEVIKGNFDIACVPTNLAATLYKKTEGEIKISALNTLGVLYIIENGNTISSFKDLEGKKICATGEGQVPGYVLEYLFEKANVHCDIEYYKEGAELAAMLAGGEVNIAMLPVPHATNALSKNENLRIAIDITGVWNEYVSDCELTQGCIIVNKKFADNYSETLNKFLEEYSASVEFVKNNIDEAADMMALSGIVPSAAVAKAAIPKANIVFITGEEMSSSLDSFFKILYSSNPASVGGALPEKDIYYIK